MYQDLNDRSAKPLHRDFFDRDAHIVAEELIGVTLLFDGIGGVIVETEAYDETDAASHCFDGWRSAINQSIYLPGGHAYVCPGRHLYNLNLVCRESNFGSAVLIRAIRPLPESILVMKERRDHFYENEPPAINRYLCAGPGPVCEALAIVGKHDGMSLFERPFELFARSVRPKIRSGRRIRISKNQACNWRFCSVESPSYVSR
ncbi:DNA-3-methyladenine glycosylase [Bradyrhizobium sp. USDA 4461]